jgi:hypothetical protein
MFIFKDTLVQVLRDLGVDVPENPGIMSACLLIDIGNPDWNPPMGPAVLLFWDDQKLILGRAEWQRIIQHLIDNGLAASGPPQESYVANFGVLAHQEPHDQSYEGHRTGDAVEVWWSSGATYGFEARFDTDRFENNPARVITAEELRRCRPNWETPEKPTFVSGVTVLR